MQSCTITDNFAVRGGGVYVENAPQPLFYSTHFADNQAEYDGAIYFHEVGDPVVRDCTFSDNRVTDDQDPLFVSAEENDYHLRSGSPCIDTGDNGRVGEPLDLDGNPRILNGVVDMGAYESVCDEVIELKTECTSEKLKAKIKTRLPAGCTVLISHSEDKTKPAAIKGKGKAGWKSAPATPCPAGCDEHCRQVECP